MSADSEVGLQRIAEPEAAASQSGGVWLCYYGDRSGFAVFPTEIEALRHAVNASMAVKFQEWGEVTL